MKEYKAVKVKWDAKLEILNEKLNEFSKDGWVVISVALNNPNAMSFVVTICREV